MLFIAYIKLKLKTFINIEFKEKFKAKELRYKNIELVLLRDLENFAVHVLIMHAVFHYMKDKEENEKSYIRDRLVH